MVPSLQFLGAWQFLVDFSKVWSSISCHLEGWLDWVCVSLITGIQQQKGKALDCDTRWWLQIFVYVHPYQIGGDLIWRSYFFQLVEVQPPIIRFNRINFRISKDIYIYKIWRQETTKWREQTLNFVVFTPWVDWTELWPIPSCPWPLRKKDLMRMRLSGFGWIWSYPKGQGWKVKLEFLGGRGPCFHLWFIDFKWFLWLLWACLM